MCHVNLFPLSFHLSPKSMQNIFSLHTYKSCYLFGWLSTGLRKKWWKIIWANEWRTTPRQLGTRQVLQHKNRRYPYCPCCCFCWLWWFYQRLKSKLVVLCTLFYSTYPTYCRKVCSFTHSWRISLPIMFEKVLCSSIQHCGKYWPMPLVFCHEYCSLPCTSLPPFLSLPLFLSLSKTRLRLYPNSWILHNKWSVLLNPKDIGWYW